MSASSDASHLIRRAYRGVERRLAHRFVLDRPARDVWIDVGAHLGETTIGPALRRPGRRVYAFEPDLAVAARLMAASRRYVVIPMAVAEVDGCSAFHVNAVSTTSSLLAFDPQGADAWVTDAELHEVESRTVPTIRLDTFMNQLAIDRVTFLKVDAQGADLAVIRSAGERLRDITRVQMEVNVSGIQLYQGAATAAEVLDHMSAHGFDLVSESAQTYGQEKNLVFEQRGHR